MDTSIQVHSPTCSHAQLVQQGKKVFFHTYSINPKDYIEPIFTQENMISHGAWGNVYADRLLDGRKVAIKKAHLSYQVEMAIEAFKNEMKTLEYISDLPVSPHIISYFGGYWDGNIPIFIFELGDAELEKHILNKSDLITNRHLNNVLYQTLDMLSFLERHSLYFGDFHFGNMVYFFSTDQIKLIDFGCCFQNDHKEYRHPLNSSNQLGRNFFSLQLMIKYQKDENYAKKYYELSRRVSSSFDTDNIIEDEALWFSTIGYPERKAVAELINLKPNIGEQILSYQQYFIDRDALPGLNT